MCFIETEGAILTVVGVYVDDLIIITKIQDKLEEVCKSKFGGTIQNEGYRPTTILSWNHC